MNDTHVSDTPMSDRQETVLAVHGNADGYWYIGAGKSIAEGPYRNPGQLLSVASDLLAAELHWRIDVFDVAGNKIISYSSEELTAGDLDPVRWQGGWSTLAPASGATH
jgi:hypothetical protein